MKLEYADKKSEEEILDKTPSAKFNRNWKDSKNKLIQGENLSVLKFLHENQTSKIDLVYIDPPFATKNNFTIGKKRISTISKSSTDKTAFGDNLLGAEYLEFLRERLIFVRELMSAKASIYLHIDYKIGHYVKILMDEIFGVENFRNDIARIKCNPKNFKRKGFGNVKDLVLFYSKSKNPTWNEPTDEFTPEDIERLFKKTDASGRRYTTIPLHAPGETIRGKTGQKWRGLKPPKGRHWRSSPEVLDKLDKDGLVEWSKNGVPRRKIFADERKGKKKQDIWQYKDRQYPSYPTEKNLEMVKMIIEASSNEGDLILDCFCGSGTTLQAASELGRKWIGIDESAEAIKATKRRLAKHEKPLLEDDFAYDFLKQRRARSR